MSIIARIFPYVKPRWRAVLAGLSFMLFYALLSGFSIALILPILEKVFMKAEAGVSSPLHVGEALRRMFGAVGHALAAGGSLSSRLDGARHAVTDGLQLIQDRVPPLEVLTWLCVVTVVAILLKNLSDYGRKVSFLRVEQGSAEAIRNDLFRRLLALPMSVHTRIAGGQLLSRAVTDVELIKQLTINNAAQFVQNLLLVVVFFGLSIWASPKLALGSIVIVPVVALITAKLAGKLRKHSGRAQARIAVLTTALSQALGAIRLVKASGTEDLESERFAHATSEYRKSVVRLMSLDALAAPLSEFWGVTIGVVVLYVGGQLVLGPEESLSVGRFFLFLFALVSMLHPLKQLSNVVSRFQRGAAAAARVFELLDIPPEETDVGAPLPAIHRDLVFENVSFLYTPGHPVLRDVSFRAPVGTTTALVGPSGAGKSTLVDLIPRFYEPDEGRILIDGTGIAGVRRRDLRALIGIVDQETLLLDETVYENIAYGCKGATRASVEAAARAANAHEFIENLPQRYDTMIGERGVLLSGGQRQRLAIARAVLRNPSILILDEATSSLDTESEVLVQEALDGLLAGRTTLVIAHRLSTVIRADQILVLDRGEITQRGTHAELVARPGLYRRLYMLQFRSEEAPRLDAVES